MRTGLLHDNASSLSLLMRGLDILFVAFAGWLSYMIRFGLDSLPIPSRYSAVILIASLAAALVFPLIGLYRPWRGQGLMAPIARTISAILLLYSTLILLLAVAHLTLNYSRLWILFWMLTLMAGMVGTRLLIYLVLRALRTKGHNQRHVVLVGCGDGATSLIRKTEDNPWAGYRIDATLSYPPCPHTMPSPSLHSLDDLLSYVENNTVDEVWITLPLTKSHHLENLLVALSSTSANIRYIPDTAGLYLLNHGVSWLLDTPMIDLMASPLYGGKAILKELEDKLLSSIILVVTAPLFIAIALGVKLSSPGPVFYRQERLSWNGRPFMMLKFRSMPVDAEQSTGPVWNKREDRRATRFGAFLRRTSLDELPQFINVLMGDMSIVGPRPERPVFVSRFRHEVPRYMQKHMIKAGITGWAQVNGWRGDTDLHQRIEHDLYYIEHWSLWFDLKIILLTLLRGFVHRNAC